jgi:hypothetical protein
MSSLDFDTNTKPAFDAPHSSHRVDIEEQLAQIQHSHDLLYKLLNLESWALAATMDQFCPGFWSRFLTNRHITLKEFLKRQRLARSGDRCQDERHPH